MFHFNWMKWVLSFGRVMMLYNLSNVVHVLTLGKLHAHCPLVVPGEKTYSYIKSLIQIPIQLQTSSHPSWHLCLEQFDLHISVQCVCFLSIHHALPNAQTVDRELLSSLRWSLSVLWSSWYTQTSACFRTGIWPPHEWWAGLVYFKGTLLKGKS